MIFTIYKKLELYKNQRPFGRGGLGLEVASRGPRSTAKQIEPKAERQSFKPHAV